VGFEYVSTTEVARRRRDELSRRLAEAVASLSSSDVDRIEDSFDSAYLVDPYDRVAAVLRAGAGQAIGEADAVWREQTVHELARAVDHSGDLNVVPSLQLYRGLAEQSVVGSLFNAGREALGRFNVPRFSLDEELPVSERAIHIATAFSSWLRVHPQVNHGITQRRIAALLKGDPATAEDLGARLEPLPDWHSFFLDAQLGDPNPASLLTEAGRLSRATYALELELGREDRGALWTAFRRETRCAVRMQDRRPWKRGELAALELRRLLSTDDPIASVLDLLSSRGVGFSATLEGEGAHSLGVCEHAFPPYAILANKIRNRPLASRFALVHELAHFLLHSDNRNTSWVCAGGRGGNLAEEEAEANAFAIYFLAPREAVVGLLGSLAGIGTPDFAAQVSWVREHFGITATQATEHIVNCFDSEAMVRRERLREVSARMELDAERVSTRFDADRPAGDLLMHRRKGSLRGREFLGLLHEATNRGVISSRLQYQLLHQASNAEHREEPVARESHYIPRHGSWVVVFANDAHAELPVLDEFSALYREYLGVVRVSLSSAEMKLRFAGLAFGEGDSVAVFVRDGVVVDRYSGPLSIDDLGQKAEEVFRKESYATATLRLLRALEIESVAARSEILEEPFILSVLSHLAALGAVVVDEHGAARITALGSDQLADRTSLPNTVEIEVVQEQPARVGVAS